MKEDNGEVVPRFSLADRTLPYAGSILARIIRLNRSGAMILEIDGADQPRP